MAVLGTAVHDEAQLPEDGCFLTACVAYSDSGASAADSGDAEVALRHDGGLALLEPNGAVSRVDSVLCVRWAPHADRLPRALVRQLVERLGLDPDAFEPAEVRLNFAPDEIECLRRFHGLRGRGRYDVQAWGRWCVLQGEGVLVAVPLAELELLRR